MEESILVGRCRRCVFSVNDDGGNGINFDEAVPLLSKASLTAMTLSLLLQDDICAPAKLPPLQNISPRSATPHEVIGVATEIACPATMEDIEHEFNTSNVNVDISNDKLVITDVPVYVDESPCLFSSGRKLHVNPPVSLFKSPCNEVACVEKPTHSVPQQQLEHISKPSLSPSQSSKLSETTPDTIRLPFTRHGSFFRECTGEDSPLYRHVAPHVDSVRRKADSTSPWVLDTRQTEWSPSMMTQMNTVGIAVNESPALLNTAAATTAVNELTRHDGNVSVQLSMGHSEPRIEPLNFDNISVSSDTTININHNVISDSVVECKSIMEATTKLRNPSSDNLSQDVFTCNNNAVSSECDDIETTRLNLSQEKKEDNVSNFLSPLKSDVEFELGQSRNIACNLYQTTLRLLENSEGNIDGTTESCGGAINFSDSFHSISNGFTNRQPVATEFASSTDVARASRLWNETDVDTDVLLPEKPTTARCNTFAYSSTSENGLINIANPWRLNRCATNNILIVPPPPISLAADVRAMKTKNSSMRSHDKILAIQANEVDSLVVSDSFLRDNCQKDKNISTDVIALSVCRFKTAHGKDVVISAEAEARARDRFADIDKDITKESDVAPSMCGFKTAHGKDIVISAEAEGRARDRFADIDKDITKESDVAPSMCGFKTAHGKDIVISAEAEARARARFAFTEEDISKESEIAPSMPSCFQIQQDPVSIIERSKSVQNNFDNTNNVKANTISLEAKGFSTPNSHLNNVSVRCPVTPKSAPIIGRSRNLYTSSFVPPCAIDSFSSSTSRGKRRSMGSYQPVSSTKFRRVQQNISFSPVKRDISVIIKHQNKKRRSRNSLSLRDFSSSTLPLSPSVIASRVRTQSSFRGLPDEYDPLNILSTAASISAANADSFRFTCAQTIFIENCLDRQTTLRFQRMDDRSFGWSECRVALLSTCPGASETLLSDSWTKNHYGMIVWTLASLERSFPERCLGRAFCAERVLSRLRTRFTREILNADRPILRRIVEHDSPSRQLMVLCVSSIISFDVKNGIMIEVTDGWYRIPARLDSILSRHVAAAGKGGKISVGTKLLVRGAELIGLDYPAPPLELPSDAMLVFRANGTRRVSWDVTLGARYISGGFNIRLPTVYPEGGIVGSLDVVIIRRYPLLFLERSENGGASITRSERAESRAAMRFEASISARFETLAADLQQSGCSNNGDEDEIAINLLRERVQELHDQQQEAVRSRNVSSFFRILVVDRQRLSNKKRTNFCMSDEAIVTVWRPTDEVSDLLREGATVNMYNLMPKRKPFHGRRQLSSVNSTIFHRRSYLTDASVGPKILSSYRPREATTILELCSMTTLPIGGFDVVGIVVGIGPTENSLRGVTNIGAEQMVFLLDETNVLLIIKCRPILSELTLEDMFVLGRYVACEDLIPQHFDERLGVFVSLFSEISTVSRVPRAPHLVANLRSLQDAMNGHANASGYLSHFEAKAHYILGETSTFVENESYSRLIAQDLPCESKHKRTSLTFTSIFSNIAVAVFANACEQLQSGRTPFETPMRGYPFWSSWGFLDPCALGIFVPSSGEGITGPGHHVCLSVETGPLCRLHVHCKGPPRMLPNISFEPPFLIAKVNDGVALPVSFDPNATARLGPLKSLPLSTDYDSDITMQWWRRFILTGVCFNSIDKQLSYDLSSYRRIVLRSLGDIASTCLGHVITYVSMRAIVVDAASLATKEIFESYHCESNYRLISACPFTEAEWLELCYRVSLLLNEIPVRVKIGGTIENRSCSKNIERLILSIRKMNKKV